MVLVHAGYYCFQCFIYIYVFIFKRGNGNDLHAVGLSSFQWLYKVNLQKTLRHMCESGRANPKFMLVMKAACLANIIFIIELEKDYTQAV